MLGPFLGQAIYNQLKFELTFYTFAAIILPFAIIAFAWIPSSINKIKAQDGGPIHIGEGGGVMMAESKAQYPVAA